MNMKSNGIDDDDVVNSIKSFDKKHVVKQKLQTIEQPDKNDKKKYIYKAVFPFPLVQKYMI